MTNRYVLRCGDQTSLYLVTGTSYAGPLARFRSDDLATVTAEPRSRGSLSQPGA